VSTAISRRRKRGLFAPSQEEGTYSNLIKNNPRGEREREKDKNRSFKT
jgi:hypothetical protein